MDITETQETLDTEETELVKESIHVGVFPSDIANQA